MPTRAMRDPVQQPPTSSATATPAVNEVTQGIATGMRKAMRKRRIKGRMPETRQRRTQHKTQPTTQRTLRPHVSLSVWFLGSLALVNPLANPLANPVSATTGTGDGPEAVMTEADPVATDMHRPWWGADPWTSPDRPFLYYGEKRPEPNEDAEPLPLPQPQVLLVSSAGSAQGQTPTATTSVVPVVPAVPVVIGNGGQRDAVTSVLVAEPARGQAVSVDRQNTAGKKDTQERATTESANQSDKSTGKRAEPLAGQVVVTPNGDTLVIVGGVAYPYKPTGGSKATPTTVATAPNPALNATVNSSTNPSAHATEGDAPVPLTTIKTLPELKAERQKRLERAVMNPSPDNMRAYLEVNAFMLGKSHAFAANFERSRLLNPTLDWTATHPTANFAQVEAKEATRTLQEQYLKHVSQASALWLMVEDTDGRSLASHADEKGASAGGTTEGPVATDAGTLALQAQFQDLMLQSTKAFAQSYGFPLYVIVRLHETPNSPHFATRLAAWRQRLLSSHVLGLPVNTRETTGSSTASRTPTTTDPNQGSSRTSSESSAKPAKETTADATPSVITAVLPDLGHTAALGLVELPAVLFIPDMKALNQYPEFLRVKGALAGKDALLLATGVVSSNELARRLMSLLKAEVDPTSNRREVIPGVGLTTNPQSNAVTGATPTAPTRQPTTVTGTTLDTHPHTTQP